MSILRLNTWFWIVCLSGGFVSGCELTEWCDIDGCWWQFVAALEVDWASRSQTKTAFLFPRCKQLHSKWQRINLFLTCLIMKISTMLWFLCWEQSHFLRGWEDLSTFPILIPMGCQYGSSWDLSRTESQVPSSKYQVLNLVRIIFKWCHSYAFF